MSKSTILSISRAWNKMQLLSFLIIFMSIHGISSSSSSSSHDHNDVKLRFNKNGEFKILQVSDMHYANGKDTPCSDVLPSQIQQGCSDLNTTHFLRRYIQAENPDFIIFSGDNVHALDSKNYNKSMDEAFAPAIESNIPWTAILGNHDANEIATGYPKEAIMDYIIGMKNIIAFKNPTNLEQDESIWGFGNFNLEVGGVKGSSFQDKSILNLYFLDSGEVTYRHAPTFYVGYDWIKPSQQSWFLRTSKKLQETYKNGVIPQDKVAPGLVFFHIPIPEFTNITESNMVGVRQEEVSCPGYNSGFFDTMLKAGDIKAAFVGHGHINDYCGKLCDIQLCFAAGFGYHGYGLAGWPRRARVINIKLDKTEDGNWGPVKSIVSWKRIHDDHLSIIDPEVLWTSTDREGSKSLLNPVQSE
ncbi:unnamed protein product [Amaranthus hypochondriacus]